MEGVPDSRPVVTVSVQFPDLSVAEFDGVRSRLVAGRPGRIVVPHEAHRWYAAASDPETVRALVSALRAVVEGRKLSFDDEEALDDLSQEYADWLEESEDRLLHAFEDAVKDEKTPPAARDVAARTSALLREAAGRA